MKSFWNFVAGIENGEVSSLDANRESFNLAVCRVLFFSWIYYSMASGEYFLAWTAVPDEFWFPKGIFLAFDEPPADERIRFLFYFWRLSTICCLFGFFYRYIAPLWCVSMLIVTSHAHSFGFYTHQYNPLVLAAIPIAFSNAGAALSLDSWMLRRSGKNRRLTSAFADRLSIRTVQFILVLTYFAAGIAKVRHGGWEWISGDTLRNYMVRSSITFSDVNSFAHFVALNDLLIPYPMLCKALAFFAVSAELLIPLALVRRKFAYVFVPLIVGLQIGIYFTIYVFFKSYLALLPFWLNWSWLTEKAIPVWNRLYARRE